METATIVFAGIGTLAIFSFLIKENPFYRFFEHLFIGVSAGLLPILTIRNLLYPNVIGPLIGADVQIFPDGEIANPYNDWNLLFIIPLFIGLFYYAVFVPKISWLSRLVVGISLGYSAGLSIKGFFAEMTPQVLGSFKPLYVPGDLGESINNSVFVITLLLVMYYFFCTFKGDSSSHNSARYTARLLLMVCFGAFFGSTVMARMALLVERLQFLIGEWWQTIF